MTLPSDSAPLSSTLCATAVPACRHAGLIWICPTPTSPSIPFGGEAEEDPSPPPQPPSAPPEMLSDDFATVPIVRDIPVDYNVLLENVMDFDHGEVAQVERRRRNLARIRLSFFNPNLTLKHSFNNVFTYEFNLCRLILHRGPFAHQSLAFDLYSGSRDHPQIVDVIEEALVACDRSAPSDAVARVAPETMDSGVGSRAECTRQLLLCVQCSWCCCHDPSIWFVEIIQFKPVDLEVYTVSVGGYIPVHVTPFMVKMRTAAVTGKLPRSLPPTGKPGSTPRVSATTMSADAVAAKPEPGGDAFDEDAGASPASDADATDAQVVLQATSTFTAPCQVATCRRHPVTEKTDFLNAFWIVPTGVGRCRFLSCGGVPVQHELYRPVF